MIFFSHYWSEITIFIGFFLISEFSFSNKVISSTPIWFAFIFPLFFHDFVVDHFVADFLRHVLSPMVSFFMDFCVDSLDGKIQSNRVIKSILIQ